MAQGGAAGAGASDDAARFEEAHRLLRDDGSIQFDLPQFVEPTTPEWLKWLAGTFEAAFPYLKTLFWAGLAAAALFILYTVFRRLQGRDWPWRRTDIATNTPELQPAEAPARALLQDADALAAAGRFTEAVHLLLHRSIEDIERRRPSSVRPALTSRDIAASGSIPPGPKAGFQTIVKMVEQGLFARRPLGEADWRDCRIAYEEFAFASGWKQ